ncbi:MAG TPA: hypothetical protein PLP17_10510, partial [Oligoflexia bacterium]|nr:hypothetical protein [Oligoflexia bacterium]
MKKRRRSHFFFLGVLLGLPVVILLINKKSGFLNQRALLLHLSNGHWHVSEPAETSQIKNLYLTADGSLWLLHHNNRISLFSKE